MYSIFRYLVGIPGKVGIQCLDYSDMHFLVALENGKITSHLCDTTRSIKGMFFYKIILYVHTIPHHP